MKVPKDEKGELTGKKYHYRGALVARVAEEITTTSITQEIAAKRVGIGIRQYHPQDTIILYQGENRELQSIRATCCKAGDYVGKTFEEKAGNRIFKHNQGPFEKTLIEILVDQKVYDNTKVGDFVYGVTSDPKGGVIPVTTSENVYRDAYLLGKIAGRSVIKLGDKSVLYIEAFMKFEPQKWENRKIPQPLDRSQGNNLMPYESQLKLLSDRTAFTPINGAMKSIDDVLQTDIVSSVTRQRDLDTDFDRL